MRAHRLELPAGFNPLDRMSAVHRRPRPGRPRAPHRGGGARRARGGRRDRLRPLRRPVRRPAGRRRKWSAADGRGARARARSGRARARTSRVALVSSRRRRRARHGRPHARAGRRASTSRSSRASPPRSRPPRASAPRSPTTGRRSRSRDLHLPLGDRRAPPDRRSPLSGIALALYNPRSKTRTEPFDRALAILREHRAGGHARGGRDRRRPRRARRSCTRRSATLDPTTVTMRSLVLVAGETAQWAGEWLVALATARPSAAAAQRDRPSRRRRPRRPVAAHASRPPS